MSLLSSQRHHPYHHPYHNHNLIFRVILHSQHHGLKLQWLEAFQPQPPLPPRTQRDSSRPNIGRNNGSGTDIDENVIGIILEDDLEVGCAFCSCLLSFFFLSSIMVAWYNCRILLISLPFSSFSQSVHELKLYKTIYILENIIYVYIYIVYTRHCFVIIVSITNRRPPSLHPSLLLIPTGLSSLLPLDSQRSDKILHAQANPPAQRTTHRHHTTHIPGASRTNAMPYEAIGS